MDVLQGIDREHWEVIDQLVVEVHDEPGGPTAGRLGEVRDLLMGHGYEVLTDQDARLAGTDRHTVYAARGNGGVPRLVFGLEPPPPPPVPAELEEVTPALLRDYLRTRLPEPMVPVDVVLLPALPLTCAAARSTAPPCPIRGPLVRGGRRRGGGARASSKRSWRRSGARCCAPSGRLPATTSSSSAAIRSW